MSCLRFVCSSVVVLDLGVEQSIPVANLDAAAIGQQLNNLKTPAK